MCTRYITPEVADMERAWAIGSRNPLRWEREVFPWRLGPFIRKSPPAGAAHELVLGQWGLIPWFSKTARPAFSTSNARSEEVAGKASYKVAWARGQRCLIPAMAFWEPCWESGRNVWWRFENADGSPLALAGLWNTWTDPASGEVHESYTMLTINADAHPLMRRMHKPDPKLPPDAQDKRSVIPIAREATQAWLEGSPAQARALLQPPGDTALVGGPG